LINNVLDKLAVLLRKWVSPLRPEDVRPITWFHVGLFFLCLFWQEHPVKLSVSLHMTMVVLKTHSERLVDVLGRVQVLE